MKKFLSNKKIIPEAIALLVILGFINSIGIVHLVGGGSAQVFNVSFIGARHPKTTMYGPDGNAQGAIGITFNAKQLVTVTACGAGGGGGGGGRGAESGSNVGAGGGGGGGGGKGMCATKTLKLNPGDTIRWLVGVGGAGGARGFIQESLHDTAYHGFIPIYTSATDGVNGSNTYVSINGIDVMQMSGGHGGQAGTNATNEYLPGWHGHGGSLDPVLQEAWGHAGENGQNEYMQDNSMGSGGYGGSGEGQGGMLSNRGDGGSSWGADPYGFDGGPGSLAGGGGGGGGGAGRWFDYVYNTSVNHPQNDSIRNAGGSGGPGGNGYITFSW